MLSKPYDWKVHTESWIPGLSVYRRPARNGGLQVDICTARFPPAVSRYSDWKAESWLPGLFVYRGPFRLYELDVDIALFISEWKALGRGGGLPMCQLPFLRGPELLFSPSGIGVALDCAQDKTTGECKVQ